LRHSKEEIVSFLTSDKSDAEKAEYVKSAYPPLLFAEFYKQGTEDHLGYRADDEGLLLYTGSFTSRTAENRMDWAFVTRLIEALITDKNYLDKPVVKENHQMSLFDTDMPEVQTVAESEPKPIADTSKQMRISQEVIDEFLRLGGCTKKSNQYIYEYYRRANNQKENIDFLKREYETDNVGVVVNDRKYAVNWDENGVRISTGEKVSEITSIFLPWESIDKRIRELMELGQYLSEGEAETSAEAWREFVGRNAAFLYNSYFEKIPSEYKTFSQRWLPVDEERRTYADMLLSPEKAEPLLQEIRANIARLSEYPRPNLRAAAPEEYLKILECHTREPIDFPKADPYILPPKQFVTQNKIDDFFIHHGNNVVDSKYRIYSFFLLHKDMQERTKFLSKEFGIGSTGGDRIENWHDGKGIAIYGGLQTRETGILLKWNQAAKRIDDLIRQGRYLTEFEKTDLDRYEREKIAWDIKNFYSNKMLDVRYPLTFILLRIIISSKRI
jgi:hypothetical protein